MKKEEYEHIGHIGVDAGLCWVGDPCYILHTEDEDNAKELGTTWGEFCDKLTEDGVYTKFNYPLGHEGLGIAISTGYGDGFYPVYIKKNPNGRVAEIRIVFIDDDVEYKDPMPY